MATETKKYDKWIELPNDSWRFDKILDAAEKEFEELEHKCDKLYKVLRPQSGVADF